MYCHVTNYPKMWWLKTTNYLVSGPWLSWGSSGSVSSKTAVNLTGGAFASKLTHVAIGRPQKIHFQAHSCGCWQASDPGWLFARVTVSCHVGLSMGAAQHGGALLRASKGESKREQDMVSKMEARVFLEPNLRGDIPSLLLYSVRRVSSSHGSVGRFHKDLNTPGEGLYGVLSTLQYKTSSFCSFKMIFLLFQYLSQLFR